MKKILLILFILGVFLISGCGQNKEYTYTPSEPITPSTYSQPELHLGISYCSIQEVPYPQGPINPATPTGIKAGIELTSQNGASNSVIVKYTVRDSKGNIVKSDTNSVGTVSSKYQDSVEIPLDTNVFFTEDFDGATLYSPPSIDIQVDCSNCKIIGDCTGCTDRGISLRCGGW